MTFPSKILLVGEFTVIDGGSALAFPYPAFSGTWRTAKDIDLRLKNLVGHLSTLDFLNTLDFVNDVDRGLTFYSTIPQGYGLGSSGALSAAILKTYRTSFESEPIDLIKNKLASIEHAFHGSSSGFDPLVSYLQQPILLTTKGLSPLDDKMWSPNILSQIYLLDSQTERSGSKPIDWYFEMKKNKMFEDHTFQLVELNESLIQRLLNQQPIDDIFRSISILQFNYFKPLIPAHLIPIWARGIEDEQYYLKLCGKGGGGYFLMWSSSHPGEEITLPVLPLQGH